MSGKAFGTTACDYCNLKLRYDSIEEKNEVCHLNPKCFESCGGVGKSLEVVRRVVKRKYPERKPWTKEEIESQARPYGWD